MINKKALKVLIFGSVLVFSTQFQSCKTGEGCELQEKYSYKTDKDGNMSTKRGKSGLWSKKQKKKMKKR